MPGCSNLAGTDSPRRRRWPIVFVLCLLAAKIAVDWHRSRSIDPQLVGRWEWSPDPKAGFPMQLNSNGSGQITLTMGCCSFGRTCRWRVEGDELQISTTPQLDNLTLTGAQSYLADLWTSHVASPEPSRRYRIVERTPTHLHLQPLWSDGSLSDEAVEVYQRATGP